MNYVTANSNNLFPHFSNAYAIYSSLLSKDWFNLIEGTVYTLLLLYLLINQAVHI
jgi:hypothetical protein